MYFLKGFEAGSRVTADEQPLAVASRTSLTDWEGGAATADAASASRAEYWNFMLTTEDGLRFVLFGVLEGTEKEGTGTESQLAELIECEERRERGEKETRLKGGRSR